MTGPVVERRISSKAFLGHYLAAVVVGVAIAVAVALSAGAVSWPFLFLVPLPLLAVFGYARLARAGTAYRLYPDRLEIESGILSRRIENIELFRVRDVGLRQGLVGRMGDFGDLYIHSTDSSTPDFHVRGIDGPQAFYKQIRELVSSNRAQSRTLIVEEGQATPER